MKSVMRMLAMIALGYAFYLALLFVQQRPMMFPGASFSTVPLERWPLPAGAEAVTLEATFGRVPAVWMPAPGREVAAPAALYFHGNAEFAVDNLDVGARLGALGLHVLVMEYPGYAGSDGQPTRATLNETARLGYDWLAARAEVDGGRILGFGRSIGSGPAVELSRERELAALVLLAPFARLDGFAHRMGAPAFLIRDRFDNLAALRRFDRPTLLFHGRLDAIIPPFHSRELAAAAPAATLVELACGHNDCPFFGDVFMKDLADFLGAHGLLSAADDNPDRRGTPVPPERQGSGR